MTFYESILGSYFNKKTIESMLLENGNDRTNIQYITHLFLHADYRHLYNNLSALINLAYPAYHEFGGIGVYALFFGGGVAAALPSFIHDEQRKRSLKDIEGLVLTKDSDNLPIFLKKIIKSVSRTVHDTITPTRSCGSSGAISAFSGCYLTLCLRDLFVSIRYIIKSVPSPPRPPVRASTAVRVKEYAPESRSWLQYFKAVGKTISTIATRSTYQESHKIVYNCIHIVGMARYYLSEADNVFGLFESKAVDGTDRGGGLIDRAWSVIQRNRIGHSAHLQGFLSGVAFTVVFGILVPACQRRRRRRYM